MATIKNVVSETRFFFLFFFSKCKVFASQIKWFAMVIICFFCGLFFFFVAVDFIDISIEMETSLDIQSVAGTENSFKYPKEQLVEIEDRVCTIEKMVIPPPPPPPSTIVKITTRSCH